MPLIDNDFGTKGFSILTAYYLAKASSGSYDANLDLITPDLGLPIGTGLFTFGQFFGFTADLGTAAVLAFRGTAQLEDWLTDGQARQVQNAAYPGKVHSGFADAMDVIWPGVKELLPIGRPVFVTGHSLGGALATLAAVRLLDSGCDVRAVYTFGSPRVGDLDFYDGYHPVTYRFVNNDDIVPHVPMETLLLAVRPIGFRQFTYKHVGTPRYLDRHGKLGEGASDWDSKKDLVFNGLLRNRGEPGPRATEDHRIANYIKAIATNLPGAG